MFGGLGGWMYDEHIETMQRENEMAMVELMYQHRVSKGVELEVFIMGDERENGEIVRYLLEGVVDGNPIGLGAYRTYADASDAADVWLNG